MSSRNISRIGLLIQSRRAVTVGANKAPRYGGGHLWAWTEVDGPPGPICRNRAVTVGAEGIPGRAAAALHCDTYLTEYL